MYRERVFKPCRNLFAEHDEWLNSASFVDLCHQLSPLLVKPTKCSNSITMYTQVLSTQGFFHKSGISQLATSQMTCLTCTQINLNTLHSQVQQQKLLYNYLFKEGFLTITRSESVYLNVYGHVQAGQFLNV